MIRAGQDRDLQSTVACLPVPGIMNDDDPSKTIYACGHCLQSTGQPSWWCWWWSPGTVLGTSVLQQTLKTVTKRQKQTKAKQAEYVWKLSPSVKKRTQNAKSKHKNTFCTFFEKVWKLFLTPHCQKKLEQTEAEKLHFLHFCSFLGGRSCKVWRLSQIIKKKQSKVKQKKHKIKFLTICT